MAAVVLGIQEDNNNGKHPRVSWSLLTALVIIIGSEQSVVSSGSAMKANIPLWQFLRAFLSPAVAGYTMLKNQDLDIILNEAELQKKQCPYLTALLCQSQESEEWLIWKILKPACS